jgi:hypothetical protein
MVAAYAARPVWLVMAMIAWNAIGVNCSRQARSAAAGGAHVGASAPWRTLENATGDSCAAGYFTHLGDVANDAMAYQLVPSQ